MAGNGNDFLFFRGSLGELVTTIINPYTGDRIDIDDVFNLNITSYDGLGGNDTLLLSSLGDALFVRNSAGVQVLQNVETFIAGNGGDVISVADAEIVYGPVTIIGGAGNDILWGNIGDDFITGDAGNDRINGGDGNDQLFGNADNDRLRGGSGDDQLRGGDGNDTLIGDSGSDTYYTGLGHDVIIETADASVDVIRLETSATLDDLSFDINGNNLNITLADGGSITIQGHFDSAQSGVDTLFFADGSSFDLRSIEQGIRGTDGDDVLTGTADNDDIDGRGGNDTLLGSLGDDLIVGGAGDDILYGGDNTAPFIQDKDFADDIMFPGLIEGTNIKRLKPPGDPALGINNNNLSVDFEATATLTFRKGHAGYKNTLGVYEIAEDGTIENVSVLFDNVKTGGIDREHQISLPGGPDGSDFGFFIIGNGYNRNGRFKNLDIEGEDVVSFVYDYGGVGERAATINDAGGDITLVYADGSTEKALRGPVYHTTARGGSNDLNFDGETHVVSGLLDPENSDVLRIGFEDLPRLGDADYEDVLFDLDINEVAIDVSETGNDTLIGGAGNDTLYGEAGNDILIVGEGLDNIHGGAGSDQIVFDTADVFIDVIHGFEIGAGGDVLNLTDLLEGFDAGVSALDNFIQLVSVGADTQVQINADGDVGGVFDAVAVITGLNVSLSDIAVDNLVVDQSVTV